MGPTTRILRLYKAGLAEALNMSYHEAGQLRLETLEAYVAAIENAPAPQTGPTPEEQVAAFAREVMGDDDTP